MFVFSLFLIHILLESFILFYYHLLHELSMKTLAVHVSRILNIPFFYYLHLTVDSFYFGLIYENSS